MSWSFVDTESFGTAHGRLITSEWTPDVPLWGRTYNTRPTTDGWVSEEEIPQIGRVHPIEGRFMEVYLMEYNETGFMVEWAKVGGGADVVCHAMCMR